MRKKILIPFAILSILFIVSCNNDDDGGNTEPPRDRGEEAAAAQLEIESFLETHFYNYEEFQSPPADFDFRVEIDTIAGENIDKTPLIEQVDFKTVRDRVEDDVTYKLYYLNVAQGGGESLQFPDIAFMTYEGFLIDLEKFDGSPTPVRFDLTQFINGFQDALIEFNGAETITSNEDGSVSYDNFGIGAVFIPSGLGYFNISPTTEIPSYAQLVFTFQLIDATQADQDNDGIPSFMEDLNGNGLEEDDDTDEDGLPNFLDADDDQDGRPTRDEIEIDGDGNITFPDVDGDGTPDYLDSDS